MVRELTNSKPNHALMAKLGLRDDCKPARPVPVCTLSSKAHLQHQSWQILPMMQQRVGLNELVVLVCRREEQSQTEGHIAQAEGM